MTSSQNRKWRQRFLSFAAIAVPFLLSNGARARVDITKIPADNRPRNDWNFILSGGSGFGPDYEGSNDFAFLPAPMISASYKNSIFVNGQSARINALGLLGEDFPVMGGVSVSYNGGRSQGA
jgi:outer membrane scaffolding protein for murein synthesis (MipA/OmpV family)